MGKLHLICELGQGEDASDPRHTALTMSHDGLFLRNRIVCHSLTYCVIWSTVKIP